MRENFYVHDFLRLEESEEEAIQRITGVRSECAHGGFNLSKIVSNRRSVLESMPENLSAQGLRALDLSSEFLPVERILGVQWAVESDTLGFHIILKDKPLTCQGILTTICSIYYPLGMAVPFLLTGKDFARSVPCEVRLG